MLDFFPARDRNPLLILVAGIQVAALALAVSGPATAQKVPRDQAAIGDTLTVAANPRYLSGGLGEFLFGTEYRRLWATPVKIPVLDIGTFAGGLTPLKRGGFGQTTSLHMIGADGVRYVFRSIDKNPERGLPDNLKNTFVADVVRDQISAQHPYASLVVPGLMSAIGILHVKPTLYVMPDDPRLGEFQDDYAGLIGAIEERPDETEDGEVVFGGAEKVKSSSNMYEDLEDDGDERVDEIAFLEARLMDIYLGDRDRHFDQWRWARFDGKDGAKHWHPIPKDRDQAFKINDGLMMTGIRIYERQYTSFGEDYDNLEGASHNGRELDRRLLVGLESSEWDSVAVSIQRRLTDEVIEHAVAQLPPEIYAADGERMTTRLKARRDNLPEMARDYYLMLAKVVDLHSSDDDDLARIHRYPNGRIQVEILNEKRVTYFERTFHPDETSEVRVLTHGGQDSLIVTGVGEGGITLRLLPGGNDDVLIDRSERGGGSKSLWYDHRGDDRVELGANAKLDAGEPYNEHPDEEFTPPHPENLEARKAQTYGRYWYPVGSVGYAPDFGAIIAAGAYQLTYGFRRQPYRYKWSIEGVITTSARGKLSTRLDAPDIGPGWESHIYAHWSRIQTIRFNGFGNEVPLETDGGSEFYKTRSTEVTGSMFFTKHLPASLDIDFGPVVTWTNDESEEGTYLNLNTDSLLGVRDNLVLIGLGVSFTRDTRDNEGAAQRGLYLNLQGREIPQVLGGPDTLGGYGQIFGSAAAYATWGDVYPSPTIALRIGGSWVGGDYPYFRASFLGGTQTIRGYRQNRYAGEAMAFGNAEFRFRAVSFPLVFPWDAGLYGFFDAGRVWYEGDPDDADTVHTAYGGGVWFSVLDRVQTFRIGVAQGEEETLVYFGAGFFF